MEEKDKFVDRLNIEALEDTIIFRIRSTNITRDLERKVAEMMQHLSTRIKIPDSPN